jgi:hypothetical protein
MRRKFTCNDTASGFIQAVQRDDRDIFYERIYPQTLLVTSDGQLYDIKAIPVVTESGTGGFVMEYRGIYFGTKDERTRREVEGITLNIQPVGTAKDRVSVIATCEHYEIFSEDFERLLSSIGELYPETKLSSTPKLHPAVLPQKPINKPRKGAGDRDWELWEEWFRYYDGMQQAKQYYTFPMLTKDINAGLEEKKRFSTSYVKDRYYKWKNES